jgi:putative tryptophan/tyrosine transport system substrate-binding protein
MNRREVIAGLGSAAAWPLAARAQQRAHQIIGWLHSRSPQTTRDFTPAFFRGLSEMGFDEGRNVAVEHRWAEGHADRWAGLAGDLVRRQVAIIVADATFAAREAAHRPSPHSLTESLGRWAQRVRNRPKLPPEPYPS